MKFSTIATALLAGLVQASDVVQLTTKEFDNFLKKSPLALIEFYAPWCGHCKALAPEFDIAATELLEADVALAKVDCTEEEAICQQFQIQGYPTLKIFRNGDKENTLPYQGQRTAPEIVTYMKRQALPTVQGLTAETLEDFVDNAETSIVGFYKDEADKNAFAKVAEAFRERVVAGAVEDIKAAAKYAKDAKNAVAVVFKKGEEPVVFSEKFVEEDLAKFLNVESVSPFKFIGPSNYNVYMHSGLPIMYLFVEDEASKKELQEFVEPYVEELKGIANIVFLNATQFGMHAEAVNLKSEFPAIALHDIHDNKKYNHPQGSKITAKSVKEYIKSFLKGTIEPTIKSAEPPAEQEGPVYILTGKEFEKVALDDAKDVLVEFYAPWCGHCKNLAPIFDQLGDMYKDIEGVVVAKLDHTENEVPEQISGYPTIKLYPAGDKENAVTYQGSRTLEDLADFIKEHGTHKAEGVESAGEEAAGHDEL